MAAMLRKLRAFVRCIVESLDSDSDSEYAPTVHVSSPPPPPPLPDADDILREILLRLPPLPSSLPVASLVCRRWRRLLTDPHFLRRFLARHHAAGAPPPPLLGFFVCISGQLGFVPALRAPDRVPASRFIPAHQGPGDGETWRALGCRHGLALFFNATRQEAVVWEPISRSQCRVALPPQLKINPIHLAYNGAVLKIAGDNSAGDCSLLSSFRLVLVCSNIQYTHVFACLYESESGKWGNVSSIWVPASCLSLPGVLVGNSIYWLLHWSGGGILEFDTESQSLAVIQIPSGVYVADVLDFQVLRTDDRRLGLAVLSKKSIHLWVRNTFAEWELEKSVQLDKLLPLPPMNKLGQWLTGILGYHEDTNAILVGTTIGAFTIQLQTMEFRKVFSDHLVTTCYAYAGFYTPVGDGDDGGEMLNST